MAGTRTILDAILGMIFSLATLVLTSSRSQVCARIAFEFVTAFRVRRSRGKQCGVDWQYIFTPQRARRGRASSLAANQYSVAKGMRPFDAGDQRSSPQRHRGGSPFHQQIAVRITVSAIT